MREVLGDRVVAYALIAERDGIIQFHTNPGLIGRRMDEPLLDEWFLREKTVGRMVMLQTGQSAYEYNHLFPTVTSCLICRIKQGKISPDLNSTPGGSPMRKYKVSLEKEEREMLGTIVQKGNHGSQKVLNALILLNCDQGEFQSRAMKNEDIASVLRISMRKIDRVKRRLVEEGLETALTKRKGGRVYVRKADGDFEAHFVALSCTNPPEGYVRWSLRLLADRAVELNYIDSVSYETVRRLLKKRNKTLEKAGMGHSPGAKR